jgi:hypothetical protein
MVKGSGTATVADFDGDNAIRWSSPKDYYSMPPNQVIDRTVKAPMMFCLNEV